VTKEFYLKYEKKYVNIQIVKTSSFSMSLKPKALNKITKSGVDESNFVDGIVTSDGKFFAKRHKNHSVATSDTSKSISSKWIANLQPDFQQF